MTFSFQVRAQLRSMELKTNITTRPVFTFVAAISTLMLMSQVSSLPATKNAALKIQTVTETARTEAPSTPASTNSVARGYIRVSLDDAILPELAAFATTEVRKSHKSKDLTLKAISFALREISNSKTGVYKLTLVLAKPEEDALVRSLVCNVDVMYSSSPADIRMLGTSCVRAHVASGIQSISSNGTVQEDGDLAAAIFAATQLHRQNITKYLNSNQPTLMHYIASEPLELISGTEYKLQMQMRGSAQVVVCDASVVPRKFRLVRAGECGTKRPAEENLESFSVANIGDRDVREAAQLAANALSEGRADNLKFVRIAKAWKKSVRGIQRKLRMTLSNDAGGDQPSAYCLVAVYEDRLSGEYELVTSLGFSTCSATPPTA